MPRYLALDFVAGAEQHYRSILNELLLAVPEHLEHVEFYPHQGRLSDTAYRRPWIKVRNKKFNIEDEAAIILCEITPVDIEKFENEEIIDVVPSSNPSSQQTKFPNGQDLSGLKKPNPCQEEFHSDDTDAFFNSFKGINSKLEEPICTDHLAKFRRQVPTVDLLKTRLKAKHVVDPLTTKDGSPISEGFLLGHEHSLTEKAKKDCSDSFLEEFPMEQLLANEIILEEKLQYPLCQENRDKTLTVYDNAELKSVLQLTPEKFTKEANDSMEIVTQLVFDLVNTVQHNVNKVEAHEETEGPHPTLADTAEVFQQLNSRDISDQEMERDTNLLESPALMPRPANVHIDLSVQLKDTLKMETLNLSDDGNLAVVDTKNKTRLESDVWSKEKYFTDISVLRLPETDVDLDWGGQGGNTVDQARHTLKLSFEEGIRLLELELPWDPLAQSLGSASKVTGQMLRYENTERINRNREIEVFEKMDLLAFRGVSDRELSVVGLTGFQRTRERIQNKLKDIPEFSAEKQLKKLNKVDAIKNLNQSINSVQTENRNSETAPPSTQRTTTPPMITPSVDPIETFMWMRNNVKGASTPGILHGSAIRYKPVRELFQKGPTNAIEKNVPHKISPRKEISEIPKIKSTSKETPERPKAKDVTDSKKVTQPEKPEMRTIDVPFSGEYLALFGAIGRAAEPLLSEAVRCKAVSSTQKFSDLTPEISRFIIREYEHNQQQTSDADSTYQMLLALHTLVTCAYLLLHCCLPSAIQALQIMTEKQPSLKNDNTLGNVYQLLVTQERTLSKENLHPKICCLAENVTSMINKFPGCKILVLCNKEMQTTLQTIHGALSSLVGVKSIIRAETTDESQLYGDQNVILVFSRRVDEAYFLSGIFACVIDYDPLPGTAVSKLRTLCEKHNVEYVALQSVVDQEALFVALVPSQSHEREPSEDQGSSPQAFIFIGSTTVTSNADLLHSLESRHDIQILERDYENLRKKVNSIHFADIDVDAQTGVVLCNFLDLQSANTAEPLIVKLAALSVKYTHCWVLIFTSSKGKRYVLGGNATINVAKISSSVMHLCTETFKLKILMCENEDKVATVVKQIAMDSRTKAEKSGRDDWGDRTFLNYSSSKQEDFLLAFPCLNSFSAQVLLSKASLLEIFGASPETLSSLYPSLPGSIIEAFCELKQDGGNIPTDHGDGLHRDPWESAEAGESTRIPEGNYNEKTPDTRNFKLQQYGGTRNDSAQESENEWSSMSYEEHEVPDIEIPEQLNSPNEFEIAEMEGAIRRNESYPEKVSKSWYSPRPEVTNRSFISRSTHDLSEPHHYHENTNHQKSIQNMSDFRRRQEAKIQLPMSRSNAENMESIRYNDNTCEEPGASFITMNRSRRSDIGGQSAYKPKFLVGNSGRGKSISSTPKIGTAGLWTHFDDRRSHERNAKKAERANYGEKQTRENQPDNDNFYRRRSTLHGHSRLAGLDPERIELPSEMVSETPRIHQPYTQPHHRGQQSFWQMPPRLPSIAAVTPSPRNPISKFKEIGRKRAPVEILSTQDSPPMDPDSDEEGIPIRWSRQPMFNQDRVEHQRVPERRIMMNYNHIPGPLRIGASQYRNNMMSETESNSPKKRRLTYQRIPGLKGGQTRLNFS